MQLEEQNILHTAGPASDDFETAFIRSLDRQALDLARQVTGKNITIEHLKSQVAAVQDELADTKKMASKQQSFRQQAEATLEQRE